MYNWNIKIPRQKKNLKTISINLKYTGIIFKMMKRPKYFGGQIPVNKHFFIFYFIFTFLTHSSRFLSKEIKKFLLYALFSGEKKQGFFWVRVIL
jgi:hypothetical protein